MAGSHGVKTKLPRPAEQTIELEVPVALDAWVRGSARGVIGHVGGDDVAAELLGEVEDMMGDAELLGHAPGIFDVGDRAATGVRRTAPQLHGRPHHVLTCLDEQGSRD
jgi:hypothetical protein